MSFICEETYFLNIIRNQSIKGIRLNNPNRYVSIKTQISNELFVNDIDIAAGSTGGSSVTVAHKWMEIKLECYQLVGWPLKVFDFLKVELKDGTCEQPTLKSMQQE